MQHHVVYVAARHAAATRSARVVAATIAVSSVRLHCAAAVSTCSSASPAIDVYRHTAFRTTRLAARPALNGSPQSRSSTNNVVNEITIPTTAASQSCDAFVDHNATLINSVVDDHRQRHGYVTFLMHLIK